MLRLLVSCSVFAAVASCRSDTLATNDGGVDAGFDLSPVQLCQRLAAAECTLFERCYPSFMAQKPEDCRTLRESYCFQRYESYRSAFEAGRVVIDAEQALACENRMANSACPRSFPKDWPLPTDTPTPYADCNFNSGLLIGKVKSLDICRTRVECEPGSVCYQAAGVCEGTCSQWSARGRPCGFGCAPGLYCDNHGTRTGIDDTCEPLGVLNDPCTGSGHCQSDLYCAVTAGSALDRITGMAITAGYCKPRLQLGEECVFDFENMSDCEPGLACDVRPYLVLRTPLGRVPAKGVCVLPRTVGQPCQFHWSCKPGLVCAAMDWTGFPRATVMPKPGTCQFPAAEGEACTPSRWDGTFGGMCGPGLTCSGVDKKCVGQPKRGERCVPGQRCSGTDVWCKPVGPDEGFCSGPAELNEFCAFQLDEGISDSIPCVTGYCDANATRQCLPPTKALNQECEVDGECASGRCAVHQDAVKRCSPACTNN